ncbi:MAG: DUF995 domain-containing protein [Rhizobiaceae bacterium]|nr:DUF995 domain-containing protein [Rhizobiaceae bacterium]
MRTNKSPAVGAIALAFSLLAIGACQATAPAAAAGPDAATEMVPSATELFALYNGRTWAWETGGAYFSPQPRTFSAWSQSGDENVYAEGRWIITNDGRVCFQADWHTRGNVSPALTCFAHKKADGAIYQRRLPDGEWYVFRSAQKKSPQEYSKFRAGDAVSGKISEIRQALQSQ